jgi:hypothetical protein|tara:strand:- start:1055 stop:1222 length:168 start_codon:yes stop_codon:yes gene_type:complete
MVGVKLGLTLIVGVIGGVLVGVTDKLTDGVTGISRSKKLVSGKFIKLLIDMLNHH